MKIKTYKQFNEDVVATASSTSGMGGVVSAQVGSLPGTTGTEGTDVTLVTYGSCCRVALEAVKQLAETDISVEVIDVQTLLPFDLTHQIVESLKKTNRLVVLDEDVPGGASSFIMQRILEEQKGYKYLDSEPTTITAKEHRPAYGTDGDYFSKPSAEDVFDVIYELMREDNPGKYPRIY